jgi:hypothetical protein
VRFAPSTHALTTAVKWPVFERALSGSSCRIAPGFCRTWPRPRSGACDGRRSERLEIIALAKRLVLRPVGTHELDFLAFTVVRAARVSHVLAYRRSYQVRLRPDR